jgi:hypothetical protein
VLNGGGNLIVTGDALIEGSLTVQGPLIVTGGISGVVPSQTTYLQSGLRELNQPISSGIYSEPLDPTGGSKFQVPRTGVYLLSVVWASTSMQLMAQHLGPVTPSTLWYARRADRQPQKSSYP